MARKKQEVALQQEIETQEEWEELLTKEGLIVIDVYQEWAGPCKSMVSIFRRIRNDIGGDNLHFAAPFFLQTGLVVEVYQHWAGKSVAFLNVQKDVLVKVGHDKLLKLAAAKADTIDSLERYRGKCEPCYLFYAGGGLVAVVRGANAPVLSKTMITQLEAEKKVLSGDKERVEIKDPMFSHLDTEKSAQDESEAEKTEEKSEEIVSIAKRIASAKSAPVDMKDKEVTVALIKPDVVKEGKADEIIEKMKQAGIEILKHEERQLTKEEAKDFYGHLSDEKFFDELVEFMCSGPSHVLLLSKPHDGKGIIEEWRQLIGPTKVEEAKNSAPDSLRAQYGTKEMLNALHGSDSHQAAARELAFFFPEYQVPKVAQTISGAQATGVQRTLALIRPDALKDKKDEILSKINEAGFSIALEKMIELSREQAEKFYSEHKNQPYFEELIDKMTSGPVLALGLARKDAVTEWRKLLGPKTVSEAKEKEPDSLRAQFALDGTEINMIHGSDSVGNAEKELDFFFSKPKTLAVIKPDAYGNKDAIIEKIKQAGFHVAARKETNLTKDIAEMLYKNNKDQGYYNDLIDHMTSGPTLFMVLTKDDAVEGWRQALGPTDPAEAKETAPDSLRAQFGTDVKANAIHGASTSDHAEEVIEQVFGTVRVDEHGHLDLSRSLLNSGVDPDYAPGETYDPHPKPEDVQPCEGPADAGKDESAAEAKPAVQDGVEPEKEEQKAAMDETGEGEATLGEVAAQLNTEAEADDGKPADSEEERPSAEATGVATPVSSDADRLADGDPQSGDNASVPTAPNSSPPSPDHRDSPKPSPGYSPSRQSVRDSPSRQSVRDSPSRQSIRDSPSRDSEHVENTSPHYSESDGVKPVHPTDTPVVTSPSADRRLSSVIDPHLTSESPEPEASHTNENVAAAKSQPESDSPGLNSQRSSTKLSDNPDVSPPASPNAKITSSAVTPDSHVSPQKDSNFAQSPHAPPSANNSPLPNQEADQTVRSATPAYDDNSVTGSYKDDYEDDEAGSQYSQYSQYSEAFSGEEVEPASAAEEAAKASAEQEATEEDKKEEGKASDDGGAAEGESKTPDGENKEGEAAPAAEEAKPAAE